MNYCNQSFLIPLLLQESIRSSEEGATFSSVPFDYNSLNAPSTASSSEPYDPHEATASAEATENEEEEDDDDDEDYDEMFRVPEILKCPMGMTVRKLNFLISIRNSIKGFVGPFVRPLVTHLI